MKFSVAAVCAFVALAAATPVPNEIETVSVAEALSFFDKRANFAGAVPPTGNVAVTLNSIVAQGLSGANNLAAPISVVLDTTNPISYLPSDAVISIHTTLNSNPSFTMGEKYYADCNITQYLTFDFGGAQIITPQYLFLTPIDQMVPAAIAGVAFPQNSCYLSFENASGNNILGSNVLSAATVVYNPSTHQVGIAPK